MIFERHFLTTFVTAFSLTLSVLLLSLSIALIFVPLPKFFCIIWLSNKLSQENVVQITMLQYNSKKVMLTCAIRAQVNELKKEIINKFYIRNVNY